MESHKDALAEIGVDAADIAAPDLCLVGAYLGEVGDIKRWNSMLPAFVFLSLASMLPYVAPVRLPTGYHRIGQPSCSLMCSPVRCLAKLKTASR